MQDSLSFKLDETSLYEDENFETLSIKAKEQQAKKQYSLASKYYSKAISNILQYIPNVKNDENRKLLRTELDGLVTGFKVDIK